MYTHACVYYKILDADEIARVIVMKRSGYTVSPMFGSNPNPCLQLCTHHCVRHCVIIAIIVQFLSQSDMGELNAYQMDS